MKMYELHPTIEYPKGAELTPSQILVEKIVEVLAKNKEDSWDRNRMEKLIAKELGLNRASVKFGISCAIMDGFILSTSDDCEAQGEGLRLIEESSGNVAEIVSGLSKVAARDNKDK